MKKAKVVLAQPAAGALPPRPPLSRAPRPVRGAGEEAAYRASLRYRGLLQDYQELLKETEAKNRRLHVEKLKKQKLLAEVKFLRKRFNSLSENPSQTIVCRVRNPSMSPALCDTAWADDVPAIGSSTMSQVVRGRYGPPSASPVIDLNEACEPSHEEMEMEEFHGYPASLGIDNTRRHALEGHGAVGPSGVRMPAFWDVHNPAVQAGKRKISWQDQLALRV